ncbi:hypothetical protein RJ639_010681 [Escallonia herrerae]|uniref:AP2/ERF domain-containing protein n=1 Tax=Escallonia herrerae TaxID=1293975 RepID=A0AA89ARJ8_9ASTE|nr:hypothetical protein RJ639_010681 [Escallonia herrerae]
MKRSPSTCSSSSSSCIETNNGNQLSKPRSKRARAARNSGSDECKINAAETPTSGRRSSVYRGVTRHRWTGRYEAHLWDKSTWNSIQNKRGRQRAYDNEEAAARTYDLAAIKYWGPNTTLNFLNDTYQKELEEMEKMSKEEYLASLRRQSSGFSRGVSKYRGVARHHHNGRWEARIGRVFGNKYLYLGTYSTQEEAAAAYDLAAIEYRGPNAVTNFDISVYADRLNIALPQGKSQQKDPEESTETQAKEEEDHDDKRPHQQENMALSDAVQNLEFPPTIETMVIMDEHDHPWSMCLDSGFNPLRVPDIPIEESGELPDLFYDTGFEDNIDFIFDGPSDKYEFNQEGALGEKGCGCVKAGTFADEEKGHEVRTSPSSSSSSSLSSTITSVSCSI